MDRDPLINLLRRADAAAGAPPERPDMAGIVRRSLTRRRRARRASAAAAALVTVVGLATSWMTGDRPSEVAVLNETTTSSSSSSSSSEDVIALRAELEQLRRDANVRQAAVDRVLVEAERRLSAAPRRATTPAEDPADALRWQREQAALVLVRQGDRLADELDLPQPAAVAYRSASETFPDTHWGAVARARLTAER